jgi:hypothetical protein
MPDTQYLFDEDRGDALDRRRFPYSTLAGNHDIDGSKDDQRGPSPYLGAFAPQRSTTGGSWLVGASSYDGKVDRSFAGLLGDVRVVDRPLSTREFMLG